MKQEQRRRRVGPRFSIEDLQAIHIDEAVSRLAQRVRHGKSHDYPPARERVSALQLQRRKSSPPTGPSRAGPLARQVIQDALLADRQLPRSASAERSTGRCVDSRRHRGGSRLSPRRCPHGTCAMLNGYRNAPASRARAEPSVFIQPTMARPISSGESSWTKWIPETVTSVCAGNLRAKSRTAPPVRIPPGSAFTNSLGTLLVASQSA